MNALFARDGVQRLIHGRVQSRPPHLCRAQTRRYREIVGPAMNPIVDPAWYAVWRQDAIQELAEKNQKLAEEFQLGKWPQFDFDLEQGWLTFFQRRTAWWSGPPSRSSALSPRGSDRWLWAPGPMTQGGRKKVTQGRARDQAGLAKSTNISDHSAGRRCEIEDLEALGCGIERGCQPYCSRSATAVSIAHRPARGCCSSCSREITILTSQA